MKKVIALALALVMLCTMAFAVTVNANGSPAVPTPAGTYAPVKPGTVLWFALEDLTGGEKGLAPDGKWYKNADNEFVPANNKVVVTYGKGAELVKSAGWVQVGTDKTDADSWQYQIVLKDNDFAVFNNGKDLDFSITKVTFKATGETIKEYVFDGKTDPNHFAKVEMDYGYDTDEVLLNKTGKETVSIATKFTTDTIATIVATYDDEGKPVTTNKWTDGSVVYTVTAGQKVIQKPLAYWLSDTTWANKYGYTANLYLNANPTSLTSGVGTVTNWDPRYNVYAVANDGTVSKVAVTVDDGVATYNVPAHCYYMVVNGTLKNVSATIGAPAPEVTNPGTGAKAVVGVAAALAVVALVSRAAVALRK